VPEAWAALAIGGYAGFGKLMALPFRTPPEIGARGGVGFASGGGGSSAIATLVGPVVTVPVPGPAGNGADVLLFSVPNTVVTPRRTGGTSLAFADTSLGTNSVRSTLAMSSFRTSTFCSTF